ETELATLQATLEEAVSSGHPALSLVSGYAGVGKSGLVHELLRSIEGARGIFLAGKFDAHQRNIPYSTFAQAFRRMLADLLAAGEERQRPWRARVPPGAARARRSARRWGRKAAALAGAARGGGRHERAGDRGDRPGGRAPPRTPAAA